MIKMLRSNDSIVQMHDIIPDIMTTGKPLGNGHPLAVAITSKEISNSVGVLQTMVSGTDGLYTSSNKKNQRIFIYYKCLLIY
jgi:glutamate-1-semialdehyde aminotransferase